MTDAAATQAPPPGNDGRLHGAYEGKKGDLFRLALTTALLTALTLGIYRFWERTRIRRYIWSATAPGGDPFEYTGTGKEKCLGFLVAVVVLGLGLGVIQIALTFVGLSVFSPSQSQMDWALHVGLLQLSMVAMLPLYGFAQYRAYRYRMSRTRWRGIRFGAAPGAWGYAWRYCGLLLLSIVSFGILLPRMTFALEAYKANRTYYGGARFSQEGNWKMLYPAMKHVLWPAGLGVLCLVLGFATQSVFMFGLIVPLWLWFVGGILYYRVESFAILTRHKVLADVVRFDADPPFGEILGKILGGGFITGILVGGSLAILGFILTGLGVVDFAADSLSSVVSPSFAQSVLSVVGTLVMLQLYGVFGLIFILQPVCALIVSSVSVVNPIPLTAIQQGAAADQVDADGFADALDVGGAF